MDAFESDAGVDLSGHDARAAAQDVVTLYGIPLARIDFAGLCERLDARIKARKPGYLVTTNVDHVCKLHRSARFRDAYSRAFLALVDGQPIRWVAALCGRPIHEKLSGSDLLPRLAAWAAQKGHSVFFLGGTPGTAERTAEMLLAQHPALRIAGINCPPYGFDRDPRQLQAVFDHVKDAKPDILFVGFGAPRQEYWMLHYGLRAGVPVMLGIGGSFDFVSGRTKRAPGWVQSVGMEWFWRLSMEPRRLWRRYFVEDIVFFQLTALELYARVRARWRGEPRP